MSESNGNGKGERGGVFGAITSVAKRLSPEFIAVILLIFGMMFLFDRQSTSRERVLAPLLNACAHSVPIEVLKYLEPLQHGTPPP